MRSTLTLAILIVSTGGAFLLALSSSAAPAIEKVEPWGTIKGRVVWDEKQLPAAKEIKITKDVKAISNCLKEGKLFAEDWVVNKDDRGLRWVFVWLAPNPGENGEKPTPLPVHPDLKEIKDKEVVIDVPCCRFEPHAVGVRKGQVLVAKNSAPIAHNFKVEGGPENPGANVLLPPEKTHTVDNLKPSLRPVAVHCNIHPWMNAWVRVFDHPYFTVTDASGKFEIKNAPAGKFRLYVWHNETGWLNEGGRDGQPITIKSGETKILADVDVKNPRE
jgi:hypothetical protein